MSIIDEILCRCGYVCARSDTVRKTLNDINIEDAIWDKHLQPVFDVPTKWLSDMFSMPFVKNNPYTKTLIQFVNDRSLEYKSSALYEYYNSFQPESSRDVFWYQDKNSTSKGLYEYALPWDSEVKTNHGKPLMYSGPMTDERGLREFQRLLEVFCSIEIKGYKPKTSANLFNSNQIQGYFIKREDAYRFVVIHGKHRVASLVALKKECVPVTFELTKPRIISYETIKSWPQVRNNTYSEEEASMIFSRFFEV